MAGKFTEKERHFLAGERVLRFNSHMPSGEIHSVPLCYGVVGDSIFLHRRDSDKRRWRNIRENDVVSLELDDYSDDWSKLRGLLISGRARFLASGKDHEDGLASMRKRYKQYAAGRKALPDSTVLVQVRPVTVVSWGIN